MWFKYSKKIPNLPKLIRKSFQHFIVDYVRVRRFCAGRVEGGSVYLFSDAKLSEDLAEDFVGGDFAGDGAEGAKGRPEVFGEEVGTEAEIHS